MYYIWLCFNSPKKIETTVENEYNIPIKDSYGEDQQGIQQMLLNVLQSNSIEDVSRILLLLIEEVEEIANENNYVS